MPRLDLESEKYELEQSPLFGTHNKRALARLLQWTGTDKELIRFITRESNYRVFSITSEGKNPRVVQEPKPGLQRLHRRLAVLLLRVKPPDYLQSGLRGRSFVTNAEKHANCMPAIKLDVKKFYPSTRWDHVFRYFNTDMKCSPDVAGTLATLVCYPAADGPHLPTGSCLSQILAFFVHKRMFDEIDGIARARGGVFTLYVDDMVLSMPDASPADIPRVGRLVTRQGLKWHKDRFYPKGVPKAVTGTIVKGLRVEANKRQHYKLTQALAETAMDRGDDLRRKRAARRARGIAQSIAQVDGSRASFAVGIANKLAPILQSK